VTTDRVLSSGYNGEVNSRSAHTRTHPSNESR
jgi:hypothetical protein